MDTSFNPKVAYMCILDVFLGLTHTQYRFISWLQQRQMGQCLQDTSSNTITQLTRFFNESVNVINNKGWMQQH